MLVTSALSLDFPVGTAVREKKENKTPLATLFNSGEAGETFIVVKMNTKPDGTLYTFDPEETELILYEPGKDSGKQQTVTKREVVTNAGAETPGQGTVRGGATGHRPASLANRDACRLLRQSFRHRADRGRSQIYGRQAIPKSNSC